MRGDFDGKVESRSVQVRPTYKHSMVPVPGTSHSIDTSDTTRPYDSIVECPVCKYDGKSLQVRTHIQHKEDPDHNNISQADIDKMFGPHPFKKMQ